MKVYEILSLEVYGNKKEGYEINDLYNIGFFIESEEFPKFADIVKILKKADYLKKRYHYHSDYLYDSMEILCYDSKPVYQIQEYDIEDHLDDYKNHSWFTAYPHRQNSIVYRICPKKIIKIQ